MTDSSPQTASPSVPKDYSWRKITARRYGELLAAAGLGAIFWLLLLPFLMRQVGTLDRVLGGGWWAYGARLLICGVFLYVVLRAGRPSFGNLVSAETLRYPPTWGAGAIGFAVVAGLTPGLRVNPFVLVESYRFWLGLIVLLVFVSTARWLAASKSDNPGLEACEPTPDKPEEPATAQEIERPLEWWLEWIETEKPIEKAEEDLFGFTARAEYIAGILRGEKRKTVGLEGGFGSGKSSLLNLVEANLKKYNTTTEAKPKRIIVCRADTWGLGKDSVAEYILRRAVDKLAEKVDCSGLMDLPGQYRQAVSATGNGWLHLLACLCNPPKEPGEELERLDEVLEAAGLRLVVFIEDIDRNPGSENLLSELAALLDRLRDLNNVSFVLALLADTTILDRLAESHEPVPVMPYKTVRNACDMLRKELLKKCIDIGFDEESREERLKTTLTLGRDLAPELISYETAMSTPLSAIARPMSAPRTMKRVLRETIKIWDRLPGEIDFDDLLVLTTMRFALPPVYSFFVNNIETIRGYHERKEPFSDQEKTESKARLDKEWPTVVRGVSDQEAARVLVSFFYDLWEQKKTNLACQSIMNRLPTDYWERYLRQDIREDISDQELAETIRKWTIKTEGKEDDYTIAIRLRDNKYWSDKILWFNVLLSDNDIEMLFEQLVELIVQDRFNRQDVSAYPGRLGLYKICQERDIRIDQGRFDRMLGKCLRISLYLSDTVNRNFSSLGRVDSLRKMAGLAKKIFQEEPEVLPAILKSENIASFRYFIDNFVEVDPQGELIEWRWFIDYLLDTADTLIDNAVVQLLMLTVSTTKNNDENRYDFDSNTARKYFGEKVEQARAFFAEDTSIASNLPVVGDDSTRIVIQNTLTHVQEKAREGSWLSNSVMPPENTALQTDAESS